jgi:hypothetical protein
MRLSTAQLPQTPDSIEFYNLSLDVAESSLIKSIRTTIDLPIGTLPLHIGNSISVDAEFDT